MAFQIQSAEWMTLSLLEASWSGKMKSIGTAMWACSAKKLTFTAVWMFFALFQWRPQTLPQQQNKQFAHCWLISPPLCCLKAPLHVSWLVPWCLLVSDCLFKALAALLEPRCHESCATCCISGWRATEWHKLNWMNWFSLVSQLSQFLGTEQIPRWSCDLDMMHVGDNLIVQSPFSEKKDHLQTATLMMHCVSNHKIACVSGSSSGCHDVVDYLHQDGLDSIGRWVFLGAARCQLASEAEVSFSCAV